jgi:hypothetical protein
MLSNTVVRPMMFVGELLPADQETLIHWLGKGRAHFLPAALTMRRAGYVAELAWQRYATGQSDDPATLSPIYLHEPPAPMPAGR